MAISTLTQDLTIKVPAASVAANEPVAQPSNQFIEQLVAQHGAPLMVLDCESVRHQNRALSRALPGVALHFALKPLTHPAVVRKLLE